MDSKLLYDAKLEQALAIFVNFNAAAETKIDTEAFVTNLKAAGGVSEEALKLITAEDLIELGLPKLVARQVAEIFKKSNNPPASDSKKFVSERKVASLTLQQLVENYDPAEFDNPVGKRLLEISKGHPCIAFDDKGCVIVEPSTKEVKALKEGYAPRSFKNVDGVPTKLYPIGEKPGNFVDENPLYPGRALRDGECDQTNRSWDLVPQTTRQLLYLAITRTNELQINQLKDAHDTMDFVVSKRNFNEVRARFPRASILFDELKLENKLPLLTLTRASLTPKKNNPFGHQTY